MCIFLLVCLTILVMIPTGDIIQIAVPFICSCKSLLEARHLIQLATYRPASNITANSPLTVPCFYPPQLENILFSDGPNMTLKIADFGIAINVREERPVTRAGTLGEARLMH